MIWTRWTTKQNMKFEVDLLLWEKGLFPFDQHRLSENHAWAIHDMTSSIAAIPGQIRWIGWNTRRCLLSGVNHINKWGKKENTGRLWFYIIFTWVTSPFYSSQFSYGNAIQTANNLREILFALAKQFTRLILIESSYRIHQYHFSLIFLFFFLVCPS